MEICQRTRLTKPLSSWRLYYRRSHILNRWVRKGQWLSTVVAIKQRQGGGSLGICGEWSDLRSLYWESPWEPDHENTVLSIKDVEGHVHYIRQNPLMGIINHSTVPLSESKSSMGHLVQSGYPSHCSTNFTQNSFLVTWELNVHDPHEFFPKYYFSKLNDRWT